MYQRVKSFCVRMCVGQRLSSYVCRGWMISNTSESVWIWPQHATYRDLYKVYYVQNTSALDSTRYSMDTAMALAQKVWNKSEGP